MLKYDDNGVPYYCDPDWEDDPVEFFEDLMHECDLMIAEEGDEDDEDEDDECDEDDDENVEPKEDEYNIYKDSKHVPGVDEDTEPEDKIVTFDDGK